MLFALLIAGALLSLDAARGRPERLVPDGWPQALLLAATLVLKWRPREHPAGWHPLAGWLGLVAAFGLSPDGLRLTILATAFALDVWGRRPYPLDTSRADRPLSKRLPDSAGMYLPIAGPVSIDANGIFYFDTGVKVRIPPGYFGLVVPRAPLASRLHILNVVDPDHRGTLTVEGLLLLPQQSQSEYPLADWKYPVAQLIFVPCALTPSVSVHATAQPSGALFPATERPPSTAFGLRRSARLASSL